MMSLGAEVIHRELFSSSLDMAEDMLLELGLDNSKANVVVNKFKKYDEDLLKSQFELRDDEKLYINKTREMTLQLEQLLKEDLETNL